eukprot:9184079-Alexandrium_andersonii.AAC.1
MRAALRIAGAHLECPGPSQPLPLHLPMHSATDCDLDAPPSSEGALTPLLSGGSSDALASLAH